MVDQSPAPESESASAVGNRPQISLAVETKAGHRSGFGRNLVGARWVYCLIQTAIAARCFGPYPNIPRPVHCQGPYKEGPWLARDFLYPCSADLQQAAAARAGKDAAPLGHNTIERKRRPPVGLSRQEPRLLWTQYRDFAQRPGGNLTIKDQTVLADQNFAAASRAPYCANRVTGGLPNRLEPIAREQPARANVRSDPERAIKIECQRSNPSCWQTISSYLLDSPAVIPGNTVVGGKPER